MENVQRFFQANLDIVFFVYGMAFLLMGMAVFMQPKKLSELRLARHIWLLGMFGLTHGLNELLDMWVIIRGSPGIDIIRLSVLISSYVFLFEFGGKFFEAEFKNRSLQGLFRYACPVIGAFLLASAFFSPNLRGTAGNMSRYLLGFPGGILTGMGLIRYKNAEKQLPPDHPSLKYLNWAGGAFLCYAFLGGLVVSPGGYFPANSLNTQLFMAVTGVPVQALRALCALVCAYGIVRILSVFNWEAGEKLRKIIKSENAIERDFHDIVINNSDGIVVTDANGIVKFANPKALMLTGRKQDLLGGQLGWELREGANFEIELPPVNGGDRHGEVSVSGTQWAGKPAYRVAIRDITERKKTEKEMLTIGAVIKQASEAVFITGTDGRITYVNSAFEKLTGYPAAEALGKKPDLLKSGLHEAAYYQEMWTNMEKGIPWIGKILNRKKDGSIIEMRANIFPIKDGSGQTTNYVAIQEDLTAHSSLEAQLMQAQKMEAVGRLAGGVAHDFNNILMAISCYAQLMANNLKNDSAALADLAEIEKAVQKATSFAKQLLAFSRKQRTALQVLSLNDAMKNFEKIIKTLMGETITVELRQDTDIKLVKADPGQISQVVLNLAINARDAMTDGGKLELSTANVILEKPLKTLSGDIPPGGYAVLSVKDSGAGMDRDTFSKMFDPFFTTKPKGKGTGLGLSIVYGIVRSHNAHIAVESSPGKGATFTIYFPVTTAPCGVAAAADGMLSAISKTMTVIIVDDDKPVRESIARSLKEMGQNVVSFEKPAEAVAFAAENSGAADILITDIIMPELNGFDMAERILKLRPGIRVIYMSGYTDPDIFKEHLEKPGIMLLQKPFPMTLLHEYLYRIAAGLDGSAGIPGLGVKH